MLLCIFKAQKYKVCSWELKLLQKICNLSVNLVSIELCTCEECCPGGSTLGLGVVVVQDHALPSGFRDFDPDSRIIGSGSGFSLNNRTQNFLRSVAIGQFFNIYIFGQSHNKVNYSKYCLKLYQWIAKLRTSKLNPYPASLEGRTRIIKC